MIPADWISDHLLLQEPVRFLSYLGLSKHAIGLMIVGVLVCATFIRVANSLQADPVGIPRGRFTNMFEAVLLFLRDDVVRALMGKEGDKFLPMLWTIFFFVLYSNLLGLFPFLPMPVEGEHGAHWSLGTVTPTGSLWVTGTLALLCGLWWHCLGVAEMGPFTYLKNLVPGGLPLPLIPMMFLIEVLGHVVKIVALAIRLWANMFGGHLSLYVIVGMIFIFGPFAAIGVVPAAVAVYFLEIIVAFLQAFIFMFLTTLFLGMAVHPEH